MAHANGGRGEPRLDQKLERLSERISPDTLVRLTRCLGVVEAVRSARPELLRGGRQTAVVVNPVPVPVTLPWREYLAWKNAAESGKLVPFTLDFLDGSAPLTVKLALTDPPVRTSHGKPGKPPHPLTVDRYLQFDKNHEDLSERRQAEMLTIELRRELGADTPPVTRSIIRARAKKGAKGHQRSH